MSSAWTVIVTACEGSGASGACCRAESEGLGRRDVVDGDQEVGHALHLHAVAEGAEIERRLGEAVEHRPAGRKIGLLAACEHHEVAPGRLGAGAAQGRVEHGDAALGQANGGEDGREAHSADQAGHDPSQPRSAGSSDAFAHRCTSLGGVESLIEHRASVEGPDSPCPPDLLRLSVGLEDVEDIIADLDQALAKAG